MTSAADASKDDRGRRATGKRQIFHLPVSSLGVSYFNADDRAAELNGGSYVGIPKHVRIVVNREFEAFVLGCIERRASFAIETTLRSVVTFEQAALVKAAGFTTEMRYLALHDFAMHLERVKARADAVGTAPRRQPFSQPTDRASPICRKLSPRWRTSRSTTTRRLEDHRSWFWKVRRASLAF